MHALQLTVTRCDGALVRVLGLVERRGFSPVRVGVEPQNGQEFTLSLGVASSRPVELLARQLRRLLEVKEVEVLS